MPPPWLASGTSVARKDVFQPTRGSTSGTECPNSSDESIWTTSRYFQEGTHPAAIYEHIFDGRKGSAPKKVNVYATKARLEMDGELTAKAKDFMRAQDSLSSSRREDRADDAHDRRRRTVRQA